MENLEYYRVIVTKLWHFCYVKVNKASSQNRSAGILPAPTRLPTPVARCILPAHSNALRSLNAAFGWVP